MHRLLLALAIALVAAAAVAGCGGGSGVPGASSPLDDALGYLPRNAPFAVAIKTDPGSGQFRSLNSILGKFPFGGQVKDRLRQSLERQGIDFEKDLGPLLGNDFVVGAPDVKGLMGAGNRFIGALKVRDKGKLEGLLKKSKDLEADGESNGAKLYRQRDGQYTAVRDDVLLVSGNKPDIVAAVAQRSKDDRLRASAFNGSLHGLPGDALTRVYANLQTILAQSPGSREARRIKWVVALRTLGLTTSASGDGLTVDFKLKTDPRGLTGADLPLASGAGAPPVAGPEGELLSSIRDLAHTIRFSEAAAQAVNPSGYGDFARDKARLGKRLHVDLDKDVIEQLAGNTAQAVDVSGGFGIHSDLKHPAAFKATLAKLARALPSVAHGG